MRNKINSLDDLRQYRAEARHQLELERLKLENATLKLKQRFSPEQIRHDVLQATRSYIQRKLVGRFSEHVLRFFANKK